MHHVLVYVQVHSLKLALEGVEKERDFYFGKLREIELLCQEHGGENNDLVHRLMEVLYASEEHVSSNLMCILLRLDSLIPLKNIGTVLSDIQYVGQQSCKSKAFYASSPKRKLAFTNNRLQLGDRFRRPACFLLLWRRFCILF